MTQFPAPDDFEREVFEEAGDTMICAFCEGDFLPEDMDGEHCRDCADALFGPIT